MDNINSWFDAFERARLKGKLEGLNEARSVSSICSGNDIDYLIERTEKELERTDCLRIINEKKVEKRLYCTMNEYENGELYADPHYEYRYLGKIIYDSKACKEDWNKFYGILINL